MTLPRRGLQPKPSWVLIHNDKPARLGEGPDHLKRVLHGAVEYDGATALEEDELLKHQLIIHRRRNPPVRHATPREGAPRRADGASHADDVSPHGHRIVRTREGGQGALQQQVGIPEGRGHGGLVEDDDGGVDVDGVVVGEGVDDEEEAGLVGGGEEAGAPREGFDGEFAASDGKGEAHALVGVDDIGAGRDDREVGHRVGGFAGAGLLDEGVDEDLVALHRRARDGLGGDVALAVPVVQVQRPVGSAK